SRVSQRICFTILKVVMPATCSGSGRIAQLATSNANDKVKMTLTTPPTPTVTNSATSLAFSINDLDPFARAKSCATSSSVSLRTRHEMASPRPKGCSIGCRNEICKHQKPSFEHCARSAPSRAELEIDREQGKKQSRIGSRSLEKYTRHCVPPKNCVPPKI